jgi:hypothetical protein
MSRRCTAVVLTFVLFGAGCSRERSSGSAQSPMPSNTILAVAGGRTQRYDNINRALSMVRSSEALMIGPGVYTAGFVAADGRLHGRKDVSIVGVGRPIIYSEFVERTGWCRPFNAEGGVERLTVSGVTFVNEYRNYNSPVCYGSTFNGDDITVSDCYFWSVLYGSNCVFKNWATGNAGVRNRMTGGGLISIDASGSNIVHHIAFHGGAGSTGSFVNVMLLGCGVRQTVIGNAAFTACTGNVPQMIEGIARISHGEARLRIQETAQYLGLPDQLAESASAVFERHSER